MRNTAEWYTYYTIIFLKSKEGITMKKYTLYVGLNDKDTHNQEITTLDAYKVVSNILTACGGATITEGRGIYTHDDGTIVQETTLVCMIFAAPEESIREAALQIKQALNQESVAFEVSDVASMFI